MSKQCCGTCKWGKFEMTKHDPPRIKDRVGRCEWPLPDLLFPISMRSPLEYRRGYVTPNGDECPTWEAKDK